MQDTHAVPIEIEAVLDAQQIDSTSPPALSRRELERQLQNLSLNADAKAIISKLAATTMKIGDALISVGRSILTFVLDLVKIAPLATFGALLGATLGLLVASIPLFGMLLGPLLTPILVAFGLGHGGFQDLMRDDTAAYVRAFVDRYMPLNQMA